MHWIKNQKPRHVPGLSIWIKGRQTKETAWIKAGHSSRKWELLCILLTLSRLVNITWEYTRDLIAFVDPV